VSLVDRRGRALSAQQVDPISWFTGPILPLVFAALILFYGLLLTIATWQTSGYPVQQLLAVLVCTSACAYVYVLGRPLRPSMGWAGGFIALTISGIGFVLSAFGYTGAPHFGIELWWAPFALGLTIASLGPFLPARAIVVLGAAAIVVTAPFAYFALRPTVVGWGPVSMITMIVGPSGLALVATTIFSTVVVNRMLPLIEQRSRTMISPDVIHSDEVEAAERVRLAQLSARVVPFIQGIAESGVVRPADRALAGQIARRLRDDLVTQSNLSWLDSVAAGSRLVVVDPERRANRMRPSQRTALRALLRAVLELPGIDAGSLLVELRGQKDGSTAVAVSLDRELPEGRRIMHLAPYYLALRTAVDDLQWEQGTPLRLSFNVGDE